MAYEKLRWPFRPLRLCLASSGAWEEALLDFDSEGVVACDALLRKLRTFSAGRWRAGQVRRPLDGAWRPELDQGTIADLGKLRPASLHGRARPRGEMHHVPNTLLLSLARAEPSLLSLTRRPSRA